MVPLSVVVVSANALTRSGIHLIVSRASIPVEVSATFASFGEAADWLTEHKPHLLIVDDSVVRVTSLVLALRQVLEANPSLSIILLVQHPAPSSIRRLLDYGVRGILHKDDELDHTLPPTLQLVYKGGVFISPAISRLLELPRSLPDTLTPRDQDVLHLLRRGLQAKEIGAKLGIHPKSVYRIIKRLHTVYNAGSLAQLIELTHEQELGRR